MSIKDPNSPEAIAFYEHEWQHALKKARETLAAACDCDKLWDGLYDWACTDPKRVDSYIGRENYELFLRLVTSAPLLREEALKAMQKAEMLQVGELNNAEPGRQCPGSIIMATLEKRCDQVLRAF